MFNSPEMAQRIQLGQGPQRANQVEAFLRRESMMDMLRPAITGNSTTARQSSDALANSIYGALVKGGTNPLVSGAASGYGAYQTDKQLGNGVNPLHIAGAAGVGALAGLGARHMQVRNQAVMAQIAKQLASQDPQAVNAATNKIASTPALMSALRKGEQFLTLGAGKNANQIQQQSPMGNSPPVGQLQPAYAKGGSVKKPTHEFLVQRLMKLAEKAKKAEKKVTAPILNMPDDTVTDALARAQKAL
jgi:flagellar hook-basal body complex protein FliE